MSLKIAPAIPQDPRLLQITAGEALALFHSPIYLLSLTEASLQVVRNRIALLPTCPPEHDLPVHLWLISSLTSLSYPILSGQLCKQLLSTLSSQTCLLQGIIAKRRKIFFIHQSDQNLHSLIFSTWSLMSLMMSKQNRTST